MTNWTITTLDRDVATGYVNCAHWTATATDGTYTSSIYSTCPIVYWLGFMKMVLTKPQLKPHWME